jgi:hypothetical protein
VEALDALTYDEPPPWYFPIRESLGAALLRNGQAAEAEEVFREDLKRNRCNGRSLFGLMEKLEGLKISWQTRNGCGRNTRAPGKELRFA